MPRKTRTKEKAMFQHKETSWGPIPPDSPPSTLRFPRNPALALVSPVLQRPTKVLCAARPLRLGSPQLPRTAHSAICFSDSLSASGRGADNKASNSCASPLTPSNVQRFSSRESLSTCIASNSKKFQPAKPELCLCSPLPKIWRGIAAETARPRITRQTPLAKALLSPKQGLQMRLRAPQQCPTTPENAPNERRKCRR